jgi:Phage portal protein
VTVTTWEGPRAYANQPWNQVVWPSPGPAYAAPAYAWDVQSALRIPSVGRAEAIYSGALRQCALDAWRGTDPLPRPRLLDRPDPQATRSWFVGVQVEDYLRHGNAISLVTSRNAEGWPATVVWIPAAWVSFTWTPGSGTTLYVGATELPRADVIHVRRGADRYSPGRGVGVIEQYLHTLDRVGLEEESERTNLTGAGVPSVAIIAQNPALSQGEADAGKATWMEKYSGPVRQPAILPFGTQVIPLSWSASDSQMVEARKMSLQDVANAYNLDGYWLGAEQAGLTYKSPGPLFLALLRISLEPVMTDFEQAWADAWLPRGQAVRFDRLQISRDTFAESIDALAKAIAPPVSDPTVEPIMSTEEARLYLGLPSTPGVTTTSPVATTEEAPAPQEVPA